MQSFGADKEELEDGSFAYDPFVLSEPEKKRFLSALGDGFGHSHRHKRLEVEKLPAEVDPGLLEHQVYYDPGFRSDVSDEEEEFWARPDGDFAPGAFEQNPINFYFPAIRKYFSEQKNAYLHYGKFAADRERLIAMDPERLAEWDDYIYAKALYKTYSKAWYEYHINEHIFFVSETAPMLDRHAKSGTPLGLTAMCLIDFSAQLGRLIEQYYWKFLVEKSAIRGTKISESARTGGVILAGMRKRTHERWQAVANLIWQERPAISKMTVASILKKRLSIKQTTKHISRVIHKP